MPPGVRRQAVMNWGLELLAQIPAGTQSSVAFRWPFWRIQTYVEASWMLQNITEKSGMSA